MANEHMKRYRTPLALKEMQVKAVMKYQYTPIRMAKIKNSQNNNAAEDVEKSHQ